MTAVRPMSDVEFRTLARFRHALRAFTHFSEAAARAAGLTPAQHQLLLAIRGHPHGMPAPMADVAQMLQVRLHSVGELVDRAEAKGLVERVADPADHRRALLTLTSLGEEQLGQLSVLHRDELKRFRHELNDVLRELDR